MEQTTIFNPVQQHLLKMFAFDGSEARLLEVKTVLANYFRKKADECLDSLWDSGVLNQAKLYETISIKYYFFQIGRAHV